MEELKMQALAEVQMELTECDERIISFLKEYEKTLMARPDVMNLEDFQVREQYLDILNQNISREERRKEGILGRVEEARQELVAASQARQAIERIRQKDQIEFQRELMKTEQEMLDEIASIRYIRRERE
jgi:flagellar FliJ protein